MSELKSLLSFAAIVALGVVLGSATPSPVPPQGEAAAVVSLPEAVPGAPAAVDPDLGEDSACAQDPAELAGPAAPERPVLEAALTQKH